MSKPEVIQTLPGKKQLTRALLVAGIACAAWYIAVRPMEQRLAVSRAEVIATRGQLGDFEQSAASGPRLDEVMQNLTGQARTLNAWTAKSGDASKLYDQFRQLAAENEVRIERVEPSASRGGRPASPAGTAAKDPAALAEVFGYNIEVTGNYRSVAKFIDACERALGATRVVSFNIAPVVGAAPTAANQEPTLSAIVETSHLKISIPEVASENGAASPAGGGS